MITPTVRIELPESLFKRARLQTPDSARELVTFLLEKHVQELEQSQRRQAYEAYYAVRTPEDQTEEAGLLDEFAASDAEIAEPRAGSSG